MVPVIFYHGRASLNLPERFVDYFEVDEFLKGYLVDFGYVFVDTSSYSDEEIAEKDYSNLHFAASLLTLKHIFSELDKLKPALSYAGRLDRDRFLFILEYIASSRDMGKEDLAELLKEVGGDTVMPTLAERWLEEGKQQGIQQGKQQGIQQGMQQGMQQGILLGEREMVLGALDAKFGSVADDLRKRIEAIEDSDSLKRLLNQVFSCNSLDEFRDRI